MIQFAPTQSPYSEPSYVSRGEFQALERKYEELKAEYARTLDRAAAAENSNLRTIGEFNEARDRANALEQRIDEIAGGFRQNVLDTIIEAVAIAASRKAAK